MQYKILIINYHLYGEKLIEIIFMKSKNISTSKLK
jgi:hypothetical protein